MRAIEAPNVAEGIAAEGTAADRSASPRNQLRLHVGLPPGHLASPKWAHPRCGHRRPHDSHKTSAGCDIYQEIINCPSLGPIHVIQAVHHHLEFGDSAFAIKSAADQIASQENQIRRHTPVAVIGGPR